MKLKTTCDWCGRVFEREASELKGKKHHFCCRRCVTDYSNKSKNPDGYASLKNYKNIKIFLLDYLLEIIILIVVVVL